MNGASVAERLEAAVGSAFCHGPVAELEIARAEARLGVRFPPSLRVFLSNYGAALGDGFELAGLPISDRVSPHQTPQWSDLVANTERARKGAVAALMPQYLCVAHDGVECEYLLDSAVANPEGECPIVALAPGRDYEQIAESFVEFAEQLARGDWP